MLSEVSYLTIKHLLTKSQIYIHCATDRKKSYLNMFSLKFKVIKFRNILNVGCQLIPSDVIIAQVRWSYE